MSIPAHNLCIYQKPRLGASFLRSYPIYGYKHRLTAFGGCDSAQGTLPISQNAAEWIYENCIGNAARIYVDDPVIPAFDGYIARVTYEIGDKIFTRGLESMFNSSDIEYFNTATATTIAAGAVNVTASQAIYMTKEGRINGEIAFTGGGAQKAAIRALLAATSAWPLVSFSQGGGGVNVTIELRGWYTVWDWQVYTSVSVATPNADVVVARLTVNTTAEAPSNSIYIYNAGAGVVEPQIQANAAFVVSRECSNGQTYLEFLEGIAAGGDSSNRWVLGITKINDYETVTNGRRVYYRPARTTVGYYQRALIEPGIFRDDKGRKIDPWRVEADNTVQVTDVLFAWGQQGQDPRATYIETVDYDMDSQTVSYMGSDDISVQGSLGLRRRFKIRGRNALINAPIRYRI